MGLRELKMARTRRLISDKAFELFACNGYHRTTIEQIAAAAEVGPRTLYRYFPTKETLVIEFVQTSLFDALSDLHATPAPLPVALNTVIANVLRVMSTDPARVMAVYELAGTNASVRAQLADVLWQWRDNLAHEVEQLLDPPPCRMTAALTAAFAINIIETVVLAWVESRGQADMHTLANHAMTLLRNGNIPVPTEGQ
ncbi:TetR family transcriptional regulator [Umezawaea tangerina]|uniref:TetR family transcriptional regulator n=2 Tax=Umezawaea tangerina TaxID=84725 RepID=A0A2T0S6X9_9PSEU|nr:TetR family transcriptional regulator [Umezawaea tangerina]